MRIELFFGQLSGQNFVNGPTGIIGSYAEPLIDQPIINGQKISFKPTTNFYLSFSHTGLIGGPGVPVTLGTFRHSILASNSGLPGTPQGTGRPPRPPPGGPRCHRRSLTHALSR